MSLVRYIGFVGYGLLHYGLLTFSEAHALPASPTPSAQVPAHACVVCEVVETQYQRTTRFSLPSRAVDYVGTDAREERMFLNHVSADYCRRENTQGEKEERPPYERSDTVTKYTVKVSSRIKSIVAPSYCEPLGRIPRSRLLACGCSGEVLYMEGGRIVTRTTFPINLSEDRYSVTNCGHLDQEWTWTRDRIWSAAAAASFQDQYGIRPENIPYTEVRAIRCREK